MLGGLFALRALKYVSGNSLATIVSALSAVGNSIKGALCVLRALFFTQLGLKPGNGLFRLAVARRRTLSANSGNPPGLVRRLNGSIFIVAGIANRADAVAVYKADTVVAAQSPPSPGPMSF